jgi:hypothetical protein
MITGWSSAAFVTVGQATGTVVVTGRVLVVEVVETVVV